MRDYPETESACPVCGWSDGDALAMWKEIPESLPPETILDGRYITGRILSVSDFSILYLSWDALLLKRVVIREFLPYRIAHREKESPQVVPFSGNAASIFEECLRAFEAEVPLVGRNQDIPGILQYYRVFRENGTVYSVSEYIEGCTLEDLMATGTPNAAQSLEIVRRIGLVIDALQKRGIMHGNISPDNIYYDNKQNFRLIDFGGAKLQLSRMKGNMQGILDARYSAPELMNEKKAGCAADIYSLGAVYYRIAAGKMPPAGRKGTLKLKNREAGAFIAELTGPDPAGRVEGLKRLLTQENTL